MNENTEKCSPARYARTIKKVAIFLVKSDSVRRTTKIVFLRRPKAESFGCTPCIGVYTMYIYVAHKAGMPRQQDAHGSQAHMHRLHILTGELNLG